MRIDHQQAWDLLCSADRILLLTHRLPDGDALGSIYALYLVLKSMGKTVRCETDAIPSSLRVAAIPCDEPAFEPDFIVALDMGDRKLLGDALNERSLLKKLILASHLQNYNFDLHLRSYQ